MQKEVGSDEAKRFKSMYETELQTREQMSNRLEKALHVNDRAQTLYVKSKIIPLKYIYFLAPPAGRQRSFSNAELSVICHQR